MAEGTARVEAFGDGVFAIAITLLIPGVPVPRRGLLHPEVGWSSLVRVTW